MHNHIGRPIGININRNRFQLGGTRDRFRWNDGESDGEFGGHIYCYRYKLSKWMHQYCLGARHQRRKCARRQRNGWNTDLYNDIGCALGCNNQWDRLQLGRPRDRLRWYDGKPHGEFGRILHGYSDQFGQWLHKHGNG